MGFSSWVTCERTAFLPCHRTPLAPDCDESLCSGCVVWFSEPWLFFDNGEDGTLDCFPPSKAELSTYSTPPPTFSSGGFPRTPGANNDKVLRAQQFKVYTATRMSLHVPLMIGFESLNYLTKAALPHGMPV